MAQAAHAAPMVQAPRYVESRIEDEPVLGPVLFLPDGSLRRLTLVERLMVRFGLTDAQRLAAQHARPN